MRFFNNLAFARKQLLLGLMLAGVCIAAIVATQVATRDCIVGGKHFKNIQSSNDLVADILPPPAYCIELYLSAHEIVDTKEPAIRSQLSSEIARLQEEYHSRLKHWLETLPHGELRDAMQASSLPALQLIGMLNDKVLPLVNNDDLDAAREMVDAELSPLFAEHKAAIIKAVPFAIESQKSIAANAIQTSEMTSLCSLSISSLVLGVAVFVFWLIGRKTSQRILVLQNAAAAMAIGDLSVNTTASETDEIGNTSRSYNAVKESLAKLTVELQRMVQAAQQGDLTVRADAASHQGVYRELIVGLNNTIEAVNAPIDEAVNVLGKVAERDLSARLNGSYAGQFESMKLSLNNALNGLCETLGQVALGAEQVNVASCEIANGSQALAHSASTQAVTLAEITSCMETISVATKQGVNNAALGQALAAKAQLSVQTGTQSMALMSESIEKIRKSSEATTRILKTIDDIAFQTNLLALNAAVEAARAGDAGKGFAVVAEEVRNLAQRSADAAKSTAELIDESVKNSEGGVAITQQMGSILSDINEGSRKVNDLISEIATASQSQLKGIEDMHKAIAGLDKLTQENAASSEESASAGEQLNAQASSLASSVSAFTLTPKLGHNDGVVIRPTESSRRFNRTLEKASW